MKENRMLTRIMALLFLAAWLALLIVLCSGPVAKSEGIEATEIVIPNLNNARVLDAIIAASDLDKPAQEPVTYEDWFRSEATKIEDCTITHYCAEKYAHICGTGDGITSTGIEVTPYWTCAVDPDVIPYGADVMVDYGDSVAFYKAQDCGSAIKGNRLDLAVTTHDEALQLGRKTATVYWMEES